MLPLKRRCHPRSAATPALPPLPPFRHSRSAASPLTRPPDGPTGSRRIVRMLLASMPPGVTIPVHHDTGEWVAKSHRVHVPIITTPAEVMFRCGGGEADGKGMSRVQCDEGRVFEMNNQAKHAVSNCSSDYRVHLILDYVDECHVEAIVKRRVKLEAGETVYQTRRSIDRERDRGRRETPSFLILGAQKAGTTSMYEYLMMHPLCVSGKRRETHFFDWRWQQEGGGVKRQRAAFNKYFFYDELQVRGARNYRRTSERGEQGDRRKNAPSPLTHERTRYERTTICERTNERTRRAKRRAKERDVGRPLTVALLALYWLAHLPNSLAQPPFPSPPSPPSPHHLRPPQRHPSCMTGDSTPSYLLHSSLVIPRVKAVCPWVKLIVMLRDPVKRAHSHYVMVTSADGTEAQKKTRGDAWWGKTFEEVVDEELAMLEEAGLREEGLSEGVRARAKRALLIYETLTLRPSHQPWLAFFMRARYAPLPSTLARVLYSLSLCSPPINPRLRSLSTLTLASLAGGEFAVC